jgi:cytidylate kinase
MKTIRDLLDRNLDQQIEEIISLSQQNEASVYTELTEYVATDRIREQYRDVLKAIAEAPAEPHEGVGIWISGFFGSGKSSFAKNLGYVLANRQVLGKQASDLFKHQLKDSRLSDLIDFINTRIPTEVIMFDVSVDRATRKGTERIAEVMYSVLLRELGYAEDYDVAELEISLEADHRLEEFSNRFAARYGEWSVRRKMSGRFNEASAILPEMDPLTYPHADSWAKSLAGKSADITVRKLVERTFTLAATSAVRWKDYRMPSSSVTLRKGTSCKPRRRRTGTPSGAASIPSPEIDTRSYVR